MKRINVEIPELEQGEELEIDIGGQILLVAIKTQDVIQNKTRLKAHYIY